MNAQTSLYNEITVDGFCGGGGWSTGFELAIGEPVTIGINHDAAAIALHKKNHPHTKHYNENIWEVDPYEATQGRPVGWAHFSPDCKHFSRAKGDKPVNKTIRSLAWVVTKWAGTVGPRIISMENVPEFLTWGPLVAKRDKETGRCFKIVGEDEKEKPIVEVAAKGECVPYFEQLLTPDARRTGKTFRAFIRTLEHLGYVVEWRVLKACDYGAPTTRSRLFIMARRDGKPIVWPEPTHGDPKGEAVKSGKLLPWVAAAEIIDWSLSCNSIFERKKPLAENTLRRIARGIQKFLIDNPNPFIVQVNHTGENFRGQSIEQPMPTITAKNGYGVVAPVITAIGQTGFSSDRSNDAREPLRTIVSKQEHCLVTPTLSPIETPFIMCNNENNVGKGVDSPVPTITTGNRNFLMAPTLVRYNGEKSANEVRGQTVDEPIKTLDTSNRYGMAAATLVQTGYGEREGQAPRALDPLEPLGTIVSTGKHAAVTAFLSQYYSGGYTGAGQGIENPVPTITAIDHNSLVTANLVTMRNGQDGRDIENPLDTLTTKDHSAVVTAHVLKMRGTNIGQPADEPLQTITAGGNHFGEVQALLVKFYGQGTGQSITEPLDTITTKDRFALVTIYGVQYAIVDIGLRMLTPRELYNAQGFPPDYEIETDANGNSYSKKEQVAKCGNSVPPQFPYALARANWPEKCRGVDLASMQEFNDYIAV